MDVDVLLEGSLIGCTVCLPAGVSSMYVLHLRVQNIDLNSNWMELEKQSSQRIVPEFYRKVAEA